MRGLRKGFKEDVCAVAGLFLIDCAFVGREVEVFAGDAVLFVRVGKGEFGPRLAFAAEGDEGVFDFEFEQFEGLFGGALRFGLRPIGVFIFPVEGVEDRDFGGLGAGECVIWSGVADSVALIPDIGCRSAARRASKHARAASGLRSIGMVAGLH